MLVEQGVEGARLPRLNENQLAVMAELAATGGRMRVKDLRESLRAAGVPESTLGTLVKRGLVGLEDVAQGVCDGWVADLREEECA